MVAGLGFALALIARDLTIPLFVISVFGVFDRLVGEPMIRAHATDLASPTKVHRTRTN
jgi:hypothetical protein